nr:ACD11 homolog protein-like [Tanacetum cinerariifolium]
MALISYFMSNKNQRHQQQQQLNVRIRKMNNSHAEEDECKDGKIVKPQIQTPLSSIAKAFEEISDLIQKGVVVDGKEGAVDLKLKPFCEACTLVSVLFGCLGIAFKFAEMEYTAKLGLTPPDFENMNSSMSSYVKSSYHLSKLSDGPLLDTMSGELYTTSSEMLVSKEDGPSVLSTSEMLVSKEDGPSPKNYKITPFILG